VDALVLFDVDGTLLLSDDPLMGRSVIETLEETYRVDLAAGAIGHVDHRGQTTKRIARLVLRAAGIDDATIDARLDEWCPRSAGRYLELLREFDPVFEARAGAADTLAALSSELSLGLLTGNPEPAARARMERLGLAQFFPSGQGGFGCDAEERSDLIRVARVRAGSTDAPWPAERTVVVGDTPREVASARAAGALAIGIGGSDLEGANALVADLRELPAVLRRLL
jgi:phosphoglycolate phosphatase-like HAD superfamily hydrolase